MKAQPAAVDPGAAPHGRWHGGVGGAASHRVRDVSGDEA